MSEPERVGILMITARRAGDRQVARVAWTQDVEREPETLTVVSDLDELLRLVAAWWTAHLTGGPEREGA